MEQLHSTKYINKLWEYGEMLRGNIRLFGWNVSSVAPIKMGFPWYLTWTLVKAVLHGHFLEVRMQGFRLTLEESRGQNDNDGKKLVRHCGEGY